MNVNHYAEVMSDGISEALIELEKLIHSVMEHNKTAGTTLAGHMHIIRVLGIIADIQLEILKESKIGHNESLKSR